MEWPQWTYLALIVVMVTLNIATALATNKNPFKSIMITLFGTAGVVWLLHMGNFWTGGS